MFFKTMKRTIVKSLMLVLWIPVVLGSCLGDPPDIPDFNVQLEKDIELIDAYLVSKGIDAQEDPSGIRYVIHRSNPLGNKPTIDSCVVTNYEGKFLDSNAEFDDGVAAAFPMRGVITGWIIGLQLLHEGDSATLYVPSGYGYGYYGYQPVIPANANLYFHIGVSKVGKVYTASGSTTVPSTCN
jgi:FKBP-type peptidyl-prolyl cis-trans isomerase FkpA